MSTTLARRELATRGAPWARRMAALLARAGIRPDAVSVAGVVFALLAMAALLGVPFAGASARPLMFVAAAAAIQLRLLCNLLDGMLAVEEGLKTTTGDLFNEIPDRLADVVILAGAGYSIPGVAGGPALGWGAAAAALLTAYVRALGGSLGVRQHFIGPMAKQHRMFVLTLAALLSSAEAAMGLEPAAMRAGLIAIALGAIVTAWRRVARIAAELEAR